MPIKKLCKIVERRALTSDIFSVFLEAGDMAEAARPGQFVHIKCGEGLLLRRPISICDAGNGLLRIVFQVRGTGTQWLADQESAQSWMCWAPWEMAFNYPHLGGCCWPAAESARLRCSLRQNPRRRVR